MLKENGGELGVRHQVPANHLVRGDAPVSRRSSFVVCEPCSNSAGHEERWPAPQLITGCTLRQKAVGRAELFAGPVPRVEKNVYAEGVARRPPASRTAYTASLSAKSTRAFMGRETQRNGGRARDVRRRASASASNSDTTAPRERPSLSRIAFTARRMRPSISRVVRIMSDDTAASTAALC